MRFFSCLISFVSRCIAAACIESVGLYIANVLTFKRITTFRDALNSGQVLDSILQMY